MQPEDSDLSWNDRISTGVMRVALYSIWGYKFWKDFFHGYATGQTDWWDAVFALFMTLFLITSATWAVRKWLERQKKQILTKAGEQQPL